MEDTKECKHPTCGIVCRREKKVKKVYQIKKTSLKAKKQMTVKRPVTSEMPMPELLKLAQMVFNKWIRERDKDKPCISSGKRSDQAGHYLPVGSYSGVRFDETNVNGQSIEDNCFNHGAYNRYHAGMIDRYGYDKVYELEKWGYESRFKKWSRSELEMIINKYKKK